MPTVYIVECEGYVKIGYAADVWTRIRDMQVGNPFEILLLGLIPTYDPLKEENILHKQYAQYHVRGEWFKIPESELKLLISNSVQRVDKAYCT